MWVFILLIVVAVLCCWIVSAHKKSQEKKRLEQKKREQEAARRAKIQKENEKKRQDYWNTRAQFYSKVPRNNLYEVYKLLRYWQPLPYIGSAKHSENYRELMLMNREDVDKFETLTGYSAYNSGFDQHWRDLDLKYLASILNIKE